MTVMDLEIDLSRAWRAVSAAVLAAGLLSGPALAAASNPAPKPASAPGSIAAVVKDFKRLDGLAPVYLDGKGGRVLIALHPEADGSLGTYVAFAAMRSGLGSTPVGVDRAGPSQTSILVFRRAGRKVVAELQNSGFRAGDNQPDEVRAVRESFPSSTVWSSDILAESPDGGVVVDLSGFLVRDAFGLLPTLKETHQGNWHLVTDLSYPDVAETRAFPDNLEFDAHLTFASDEPGPEIRGIAQDPRNVTVIAHQSLIRLPPPGFQPRLADPRTGSISELVADYGTPLTDGTVKVLSRRFRLEKTDPTAARSPVKKPIVFYVDRAAPEPVRSALVQGARWWADAFDAAGFIDAFRVEVLPEGADPMDVRYNMINWVHRQTRGWSYGWTVADPRTGEILKGSVLLGSLRIRQDRMILEGLVGTDQTGKGGPNDPVQVSLARIRQLAVHETGHAIGLAHNFAASTYDDRASVMDYPPPRVTVRDGALDLSDAYKVGIGSWDRFAIKWLYTPVADGAEGRRQLDAIVADGYAHGLRYVSDEDSRPTGSANPAGALWDDGTDPVAGLAHVMEVRRIALQHFGVRNLPDGAPVSDLRRVLVPVYLFHRYEVDAAAKLVGGIDFTYAVKGDPREASRVVPAADQRRGLDAVLATLDPAALDLPDPLLDLLSQGRDSPTDKAFDGEVFGVPDAHGFDLGTAADAAVDIAVGDLFNTERLNRVADQGGRDPAQLGVTELVGRTLAAVYPAPGKGAATTAPHGVELRRRIQARTLIRLAVALQDPRLNPGAAAAVRFGLEGEARRLATAAPTDPADLAQARYLSGLILAQGRDGIAALAALDSQRGLRPPPGMPIGQGESEMFDLPAGR